LRILGEICWETGLMTNLRWQENFVRAKINIKQWLLWIKLNLVPLIEVLRHGLLGLGAILILDIEFVCFGCVLVSHAIYLVGFGVVLSDHSDSWLVNV
jgi:hypothetical protein